VKYASLHHHSTFSYKDGYGLPAAHVERAAEIGMGSFALTEHGNVSSHVQFEKAAQEAGIHPVFGVELYTGAKDKPAQTKWHLTVLAENQVGYQNLLRVVTEGWNNFYYYPTVTSDILREYGEGLIILSGCTGSLLATSLIGGKGKRPEDASYEEAREIAGRFKSIFGDRYFLEVQAFPGLAETCEINPAYQELSMDLDIPLVATLDVHYPRIEDQEMQMILHKIRDGFRKINAESLAQEWEYQAELTFKTDREVWDLLRATGLSGRAAEGAVRTSLEIAERCKVVLPKMERLRFTPSEEESRELIWEELRRGWKYRRVGRLSRDEQKRYIERLKYEMDIITQKDFIDYFLFIGDLVRHAKDREIAVGPARGSAAASLVCWLLRITEVDPMEYPILIFERFIDITREDLPDVDLDFDDDRRHEVREYLVEKYGAERVGNIANFVRFKGRNSISDIGMVYRVPKWETEKFFAFLIERASHDLRSSATIEDTCEMFPEAKAIFDTYPDLWKSQRLEGNYRQMSVHAAGLVVGQQALNNYVATYRRSNSDGSTIDALSVDKRDAEWLGIMKADVLGLTTMGLLRIALDLLGMKLEDLYKLPLNDPRVFEGFQRNDVTGVFQFDGFAARTLNRDVKPSIFLELADINALARPGPLHSGGAADYINIKNGTKPRESIHPLYDRITAHTQGQVIYQEQVLQLVREMGGFEWTHAQTLRRIISQRRGKEEFNKHAEPFLEGAERIHGIGRALALRIWKLLLTSGSYAFNAAHAVSYSMIGYWTMWLKVYHPLEFYVSSLRKYGEEKAISVLRDAVRHGIEVYPPALNFSETSWSIERDEDGRGLGIRAGLEQVPNVGSKSARAIVELREELRSDGTTSFVVTYDDMMSYRPKGASFTGRQIRSIRESEDNEDPFKLDLLGKTLEAARRRLLADETEEEWAPTHRAIDIPYEARYEEVTWIGVIRQRNLKDIFEAYHGRTGETLDISTVKDPELVEWVVMTGEDDSDVLILRIDRWRYPRWKDLVWSITPNEDLVVVHGFKKMQFNRMIHVDRIRNLGPSGNGNRGVD
jgi:DNA polymerase-3 subunit alpha